MSSILILEDNALNFKLWSDLLESQGYEVAGDGHQIPVMRRALQTKPDLIITGIQQPEFSGLTFLRWIRTTPQIADVSVLVVTAFGMKGDKEKIESHGADYYLNLPLRFADFLDIVAKLLDPDQRKIVRTETQRRVWERPFYGADDPLEPLQKYLNTYPGVLEPGGWPPKT
jgi:two-component system cell cycle response regulator DivK